MTTTIPTPYDAEIAEHIGKRDTWLYVSNLQSKAEGYRQAKAEDAALLEAAKEALATFDELERHGSSRIESGQTYRVASKLSAAIAKATGKE